MCCRKARPRLTDLLGRMPNKRQAGWPSLLVTFLLATQEKSDSVAEGDRPLLPLNATRAKASRASALLQKHSTALLPCIIRHPQSRWMPAFAGMTGGNESECEACPRRHDVLAEVMCRHDAGMRCSKTARGKTALTAVATRQPHSFLIACPPNSLRSEESSLSAKESSSRER